MTDTASTLEPSLLTISRAVLTDLAGEASGRNGIPKPYGIYRDEYETLVRRLYRWPKRSHALP
jgi:hypothetical protein